MYSLILQKEETHSFFFSCILQVFVVESVDELRNNSDDVTYDTAE